jgi:hypothetical protein
MIGWRGLNLLSGVRLMPVLDDGLLHRATCMPFGLDLQIVAETRRRFKKRL